MTCEEAQELITGLVDQELSAPERHALEAHLRDCAACRLAAERERQIKKAVRGRAEQLRAPPELRTSLLADQRIFPAKSPARRAAFRPSGLIRNTFLAAAVLAALALPLYLFERPGRETVAAAAVARYGALTQNELSMIRAENPDELAERLVRAAGGHLHPMGYDLSAMGLRPAAGAVQEIQGRKVLVVVYRGEAGTLICFTFPGSEADAPVHAAKFSDPAKPMSLYAFSQGTVNAVLHREGELICVLASDMPMEKLLALARSKARTA